jgi:tRNA pseudouridine38-40 synthase
MTRFKLVVEYDGTGFVGWQRQDNGPSIQGELERAIAGFCGAEVTIVAAGRTDAGVHALGQVVHADLPRAFPTDTVRDAINQHLKPSAIAVLSAQAVGDDFHARFSAIERRYLYRIVDRRAPLALERGKAWHVRGRLDCAAMHEAAQRLIGKHDFTTFRAAQCQARSPVKTLDELTVTRRGESIEIRARARSFLHNQVRSMVGSLKRVGEGKWTADDLANALAAADRSRCGPVAPPEGLYLTEVGYPGTAGE